MASQLLTRAELEVLVKKNDSSIKLKKVKANEEHEYYSRGKVQSLSLITTGKFCITLFGLAFDYFTFK